VKTLMIGPFPPPIHGMSLANQMLKEGLSRNHAISILNTNTEKNLGNLKSQGKLTEQKFLMNSYDVV